MTSRVCPACARRYAQVIDPDCLVCEGSGIVVLGAAALSTHPPAAVSRAVDFLLEAAGREAAGQPLAVRASTIRAKLADASQVGLIGRRRADGTAQPRRRTQRGPEPVAVEAAAASIAAPHGYEPSFGPALDAPQVRYAPDDRPLAAGRPLGHSADGHRSALAQIMEPAGDGWSVAGWTAMARADDRGGMVLLHASHLAASERA